LYFIFILDRNNNKQRISLWRLYSNNSWWVHPKSTEDSTWGQRSSRKTTTTCCLPTAWVIMWLNHMGYKYHTRQFR